MDGFSSIVTPLLAVVAVIAGAYLTTKWYAKRHNGCASGNYIKIIERAVLGKDSYLVVAEVGAKAFLLSMTSQRVEMLCELDPETLKPFEQKRPESDFAGILSAALSKKPFDLIRKKGEDRSDEEK